MRGEKGEVKYYIMNNRYVLPWQEWRSEKLTALRGYYGVGAVDAVYAVVIPDEDGTPPGELC